MATGGTNYELLEKWMLNRLASYSERLTHGVLNQIALQLFSKGILNLTQQSNLIAENDLTKKLNLLISYLSGKDISVFHALADALEQREMLPELVCDLRRESVDTQKEGVQRPKRAPDPVINREGASLSSAGDARPSVNGSESVQQQRPAPDPVINREGASSSSEDDAQPSVNGSETCCTGKVRVSEKQMQQMRIRENFKEEKADLLPGRSQLEKLNPEEDKPELVDVCIIVSKNVHELDAAGHRLKGHPDLCGQIVGYKKACNDFEFVFYVGSMEALDGSGKSYSTALVSCEQGSFSTNTKVGSLAVAYQCIQTLKPKFIATIGVAFGTPYEVASKVKGKNIKVNKELRVVDVLVSESIAPVKERIGIYGGESRSELIPCFPHGIASLRAFIKEYNKSDKRESRVASQRKSMAFIGPMLSSDKLLDNGVEHLRMAGLHANCKDMFIGGEMEGAGILEMCRVVIPPIPFLVIKGISDWADGKKKQSSEMQAVAANEAMDFFLHALPEIADKCGIEQLFFPAEQ